MKKIYTLCLLALMPALSTFAQIDVKTQMLKPTAGTTWDAGQYYPFEIVVTIVSGSVAPADTVWYTFTDGSKIYGRTNLTKAAGDTVHFSNNIGYGTGVTPKSNYKWCAWAFVRKNGVKYTDPDATNDSGCTTINVTNTTSIGDDPYVSEIAKTAQLQISPNPASGFISFNYATVNGGEVKARVLNLIGQQVAGKSFGNATGKVNNYQLDISSLPAGIYIVEMNQENGTHAIGRVIKQ